MGCNTNSYNSINILWNFLSGFPTFLLHSSSSYENLPGIRLECNRIFQSKTRKGSHLFGEKIDVHKQNSLASNVINSLGCRKEGLNEPRSKGGQIKQTDAQKEGWSSVCRVKNQHKLKSPVTCVDLEKIDFIRLELPDFSTVYRIFQIGHSMRKKGRKCSKREKNLEENFSSIWW